MGRSRLADFVGRPPATRLIGLAPNKALVGLVCPSVTYVTNGGKMRMVPDNAVEFAGAGLDRKAWYCPAAYMRGGASRRKANARSQRRSGSRSPAFASSMIFPAMTSGARSSWFEARSAARVISNATPMIRLVSKSKYRPSKYGLMDMPQCWSRQVAEIMLRLIRTLRDSN